MLISSDKSSAVNGKNDFLKLVAMLSMVVDHVGLVFFPQVVALRIVGRIAFPIFASGIADGYRYTSNLKMYLYRLLFFGAISQIPFMIMAGKYELNILFSFVLSLLFIFALDKKKYWLGISVLLFIFFIKCDYGFYGIAMVSLFYFLRAKKLLLTISLAAISLFFYKIYNQSLILFSFLGFLPAIYFPNKIIKVTLPRHFFYWFYPIHLIILIFIKYIINLWP